MEANKLPELPPGKYKWWHDYYEGLTLSDEPEDRYRELGLYDEDQMRAYGQECARLERERCALICDKGSDLDWTARTCAAAIRRDDGHK